MYFSAEKSPSPSGPVDPARASRNRHSRLARNDKKMGDEHKKKDDVNSEEELAKCKVQCEDYLNNWKRERADFVNYKKEESRRVEQIVKFANEGLALEIIDVVDGLEEALKKASVEMKDKHADWYEGIEKAIKNFEKTLEKYEITRIKVVGEKFNPGLHEAVEMEKDGEKLEEVRAGYMMQDKVIRPSRVRITK
ncbi:MAG: Protein GrpE [Candidatus Yanofskybacteria bacterium GW2011_GWF1_44_227]|uniref:Protein GrpE n=1 Tax=Candidatus Yanofskybacteria bacterium GW2011_GWE2_40_11 TaxID=1619033 RepID=A0A0G0QV69_9BACT|nr:MAG: Protein GrpE [Candidatus Yanofskybacteria bacterium GW2011_GWE2_40_11]KKT15673.1 MAG: Protein GrpE [Candidatus Yanofskybacteria bacterium GW2011_GWF2_43_596]KKT52675.1 MAG: Protein GrpE [Candidatus Yanofskybacteria bacterium GW2011_GWF1_44_227]